MASKGNEALLAQWPQLQQPVRIGIVKTAWNAHITNELEAGARRVLQQAGIADVQTWLVPGAVEVPYMIRQIAGSQLWADAYLAFACVVRGDTPHFDYVCQSITHGITELNLQLPSPVVYGVLTVNTEQQAEERIGGVHGHKGEEAALTALQMIAATRSLR
ncbi:MAG: 6,7-dimethyl-8-ribityllumazine synthase [Chitinophagaceae bacterium]|jgi:6,7-dimethyl-8-ribityllumazine synthase|nr:6,7-dimethyl-8-ribityllumazine synthase [Chitinophagaceae bacterium]